MQKKRTKSRQEKRDVWVRLGMGLCIGLAVMLFYILRPPMLVQTDRLIYDRFLQTKTTQEKLEGISPSATPALLDLDEKSLTRYGQWPWPRHLLARLIKILTENGAAAIGLDILLSEDDRTSPVQLRQSLKKSFGIDVRFEGLPEALADNDALLATIVGQAPVVSGFYLHFKEENAVSVPTNLSTGTGIVEQNTSSAIPLRTHLLKAYGATLPLLALRKAAPLGSINVAPDPDGIVRAVPLVVLSEGRIYPSLALRSLMRGLGHNTLILRSGPDGLQSLRFGTYEVPVTPQGLFHVPFRGPRHTYPYFSAADVLDGLVPASEIQGRVFIVGTSSPGLLDIRATPLDPVFPGMEVHAAVIDSILSKRYLELPAWIPGAQVLSIVFVCFIASLAFALAPPTIYLPLSILLGVGGVWTAWKIYLAGVFFSPLYIVLTIVLVAITLLAVRFWQEMRQKRMLRQAFNRYLAPDLVDRVADRDTDIFAGEEREVTLMFTDIRSFTTLSEGLRPEQVVAMLNRYFTPMTAIIRSSQGTVDKFIGDAIMAFWNAPLDVPLHEVHAVRSALAMQQALGQLNDELHTNFGVRLAMGAGVHTGRVYVGNMGTSELLDYTCIGDTVNLASRLEGMCPVYGVGVVVSGDCAMRCCAGDAAFSLLNGHDQAERALAQKDAMEDTITFVALDSIRVKGKAKPVEIFTPLSHAELKAQEKFLQGFVLARDLYSQGRFEEALAAFKALLVTAPGHKMCTLYAERCAELIVTPPQQWDGVWTFTKK